ncbi:MAG: S8 family serine peptidase [Oligoflexia bacterium]|nr:S8 family serine peptidase [Oligoflexia bacterium]
MQIIKKKNFFSNFILLSISLIINNFIFLISTHTVNGSVIAVIDSGVDINANIIRNHLWINKYEVPNNFMDDDNNGYIDDIFGWNFVDNNNLVIDNRYRNQFNSDHKLFFDIQSKITYETASEDEISWIKQRINDKKFMNQIKNVGTYIHGTHVAGIAVNETSENKIQSIKIISTPKSPDDEDDETNPDMAIEDLPIPLEIQQDVEIAIANSLSDVDLIKYVLSKVAFRQMELMKLVVKYAIKTDTQVANASFGTSYSQGNMLATIFFRMILKRFPTNEELESANDYFFDQLILNGRTVFASGNKILFIFAAGNDGVNNDLYPTTPTNVKLENTISVAAWMNPTVNRPGELADFSNFGNKTVEVAAPGVGIVSIIPGSNYACLSGTSQAAPFVSNIAGEILNINPRLLPKEVKEIIIKTVDYKSVLRGKVTSSGVVNKNRAILAATYSKRNSLSQAIRLAKEEMKSLPINSLNITSRTDPTIPPKYKELEYIIPIPSEFENILHFR